MKLVETHTEHVLDKNVARKVAELLKGNTTLLEVSQTVDPHIFGCVVKSEVTVRLPEGFTVTIEHEEVCR